MNESEAELEKEYLEEWLIITDELCIVKSALKNKKKLIRKLHRQKKEQNKLVEKLFILHTDHQEKCACRNVDCIKTWNETHNKPKERIIQCKCKKLVVDVENLKCTSCMLN